jgi:hypothetical protein
MTTPTGWAFDAVGYQDMSGQQFCLGCAPGSIRHETHELLRFEVEDECVQCGTDISATTNVLPRTYR